jgi:hypothetical protein
VNAKRRPPKTFSRETSVSDFSELAKEGSSEIGSREHVRARADSSRVMPYALVASQTVRVAAAARGTRRAVSARRAATVAARASSRTDDVAVAVRARRAAVGLASAAAVAAAPAAPAHAATAELAQVRPSPRAVPALRNAPTPHARLLSDVA